MSIMIRENESMNPVVRLSIIYNNNHNKHYITMKRYFLIAMTLTATVCPLHAEIETTVGADIVSRYCRV